jgi:hypothetical protein
MSPGRLFTGQAELGTVSVKYTHEDVKTVMHLLGKCRLLIV